MPFMTINGTIAAILHATRSMPPSGRLPFDHDGLEIVERQITSPCLSGPDVLKFLGPVAFARPTVFTGKKIDLHENGLSIRDGYPSEKNERLISFSVAPFDEGFSDRLVCLLIDKVIQGKVDIHAAHVLPGRLAVKKRRNPASHEDKGVLELAQQVDELNENGPARFYFSLLVVLSCDHVFSSTCPKMNCAASSPLPL